MNGWKKGGKENGTHTIDTPDGRILIIAIEAQALLFDTPRPDDRHEADILVDNILYVVFHDIRGQTPDQRIVGQLRLEDFLDPGGCIVTIQKGFLKKTWVLC